MGKNWWKCGFLFELRIPPTRISLEFASLRAAKIFHDGCNFDEILKRYFISARKKEKYRNLLLCLAARTRLWKSAVAI